MGWPTGGDQAGLSESTRVELDTHYAQLQGMLGQQHNADGSHTAISADMITTPELRLIGTLEPPQITANVNDYSPAGLDVVSHLRVNSDAARDITGLGTGKDGRLLFVSNGGGFDITFKNNSSSSIAGNRLVGANSSDVVMRANNGSVLLRYDQAIGYWFVIGA